MKWIKIFDNLAQALERIAPNKAVLVKIGSKRISLCRFKDALYATDDHCPHNGDHLSNGQVNFLGEIVCPWHNYRFNVKSGKECEERTVDLKTYPIEVRSDGVFIGINYE